MSANNRSVNMEKNDLPGRRRKSHSQELGRPNRYERKHESGYCLSYIRIIFEIVVRLRGDENWVRLLGDST